MSEAPNLAVRRLNGDYGPAFREVVAAARRAAEAQRRMAVELALALGPHLEQFGLAASPAYRRLHDEQLAGARPPLFSRYTLGSAEARRYRRAR